MPVHEQDLGGHVGPLVAAEAFDEVQHEVQEGGGAAGGDDLAVVDDHSLDRNKDFRVATLQLVREQPVGRRRSPIQQAGIGHEERPRARAGDSRAGAVPLGNPGRPCPILCKGGLEIIIEAGDDHQVRRGQVGCPARRVEIDAVATSHGVRIEADKANVEERFEYSAVLQGPRSVGLVQRVHQACRSDRGGASQGKNGDRQHRHRTLRRVNGRRGGRGRSGPEVVRSDSHEIQPAGSRRRSGCTRG
jgi:hypothetical protein